MSLTVVFPDFSAKRKQRDAHSFACTLHANEIGPAWVRVAGDLDVSSAPRLAQALRHTHTLPRLVVLDLRELTSIGSAGVDVIVDAARRARRAKSPLMVVRGPSQVDRMLATACASDVLKIVDFDLPERRATALRQLPRTDDAA